uniref:MTM0564 n=1 Tax=Volvox carteri f. nagariensis TaxID=3068 RepID=D9CJ67_VOLCA|nr:MTM0564 [Volvox carteri f. nagariensis]
MTGISGMPNNKNLCSDVQPSKSFREQIKSYPTFENCRRISYMPEYR